MAKCLLKWFSAEMTNGSANCTLVEWLDTNGSEWCEMAQVIGKWLIVSRNGIVSHQSTHRKVKWFSVTPNGLAWRQKVKHKPKWSTVTAVGLRRKSQKYKSEIDKSSFKWNIRCGVLSHSPIVFIVFRRPDSCSFVALKQRIALSSFQVMVLTV